MLNKIFCIYTQLKWNYFLMAHDYLFQSHLGSDMVRKRKAQSFPNPSCSVLYI